MRFRQAGHILQLLPATPDEVIDSLEKKLAKVASVTSMLEDGLMPEDILQELLGEFGLEIMEKNEVSFRCNCSKDRIEKALISIGPDDVREMIDDGKPIEVGCQFCGKQYQFDIPDLKKILEIQTRGRRQGPRR